MIYVYCLPVWTRSSSLTALRINAVYNWFRLRKAVVIIYEDWVINPITAVDVLISKAQLLVSPSLYEAICTPGMDCLAFWNADCNFGHCSIQGTWISLGDPVRFFLIQRILIISPTHWKHIFPIMTKQKMTGTSRKTISWNIIGIRWPKDIWKFLRKLLIGVNENSHIRFRRFYRQQPHSIFFEKKTWRFMGVIYMRRHW